MTVSYTIKWTNEFTEEFINDFMKVENEVLFGGYFTRDLFNLKYCDDIYGSSVLIVAYVEETPVGAHALWRNDIDGKESYQSVDSCVLPQFQGLLIFPEMISNLKAAVPRECPIYGFPNSQSGPIAKLLKHKVLGTYRTRIFLSYKKYHDEHPDFIPFDYAKWWIRQYDKSILSVKKGKHYFLVRKRKTKGTLWVIGETDKDTASLFPRTKGLFILTYPSGVPQFYNKRQKGYVILNQRNFSVKVPNWKVDAI